MQVRPITQSDARAFATLWRYPGRDSTYDVKDPMSGRRGHWSVVRGGELIGYCCFGAEARVPGVDTEEGTLDVGYGLRPDLVGKGLGQEFVTAILDFGIRRYDPSQLRVLILDWNDRSRKVAERCGFTHRETIASDERPFLVLTRRIR